MLNGVPTNAPVQGVQVDVRAKYVSIFSADIRSRLVREMISVQSKTHARSTQYETRICLESAYRVRSVLKIDAPHTSGYIWSAASWLPFSGAGNRGHGNLGGTPAGLSPHHRSIDPGLRVRSEILWYLVMAGDGTDGRTT
ncbi:hypothetical protein B0H14DRAFT_2556147 [Mycena olivaceomarginata]|nr:hypothetical protein B0H14DRAFT_2556147 [Mycena olivaceomarginata]